MLRNDLQFERYNLVTPRDLDRTFASVPGLGAAAGFGTPVPNLPGRPHQDELTLRAPANEAPAAPVVVYPVDNPTPIVRSESTRNALMLAGDGDGLIDAAEAGLLDGAGIVQYSGSYATRAGLRAALEDDTTLVLTDSNRRAARRWTSVRDNVGVTEQPEKAIRRSRRRPARGVPRRCRRSTVDDGPARCRVGDATSYGNTITYTPEDSAAARSTAMSRPAPVRSAPRSVR